MQVYVLLFNAGTDNEGIHSISANGRNTVMMFESEDDATRFGLMLEAQDFPSPTVEAFDQREIEEFCQGAGFDCKLVPEGMLTMPPETNLEKTDWDPEHPAEPSTASDKPASSESEFSPEEMDAIRQRLENLL